MRKSLYIFLSIFLLSSIAYARPGFYPVSNFNGGCETCLDSINGTILKDGDKAYVIKPSGQTAFYVLDDDSGLDEDSTNLSVISPDSNAGDKRWIMQWSVGRVILPDSTIDQGDSSITGTLAWHISNASGNDTTIKVLSGTYTISTTVTVPATITLIFDHGAVIQDDSSNADLTVNGPLRCDISQHFDWGTGSGSVSLSGTKNRVIYPQWLGSPADGTSDDETYVQQAIDAASSGAIIDFGNYSWRISRNTGTNDRWGIKIKNSDITLRGDGATMRRYNTDISTYALAYPIILVGTPDSNVASATENVTIKGITFIGEDTRHSSSGDYLHDGRYAIEAKNTNRLVIDDCKFTLIDSSAIYFQFPDEYDYVNSEYYNTTKSYNAKIINSDFIAESHSTAGRGLIHAIVTRGVDGILISGNYSEWCDDFIQAGTTYDELDDLETDTYTGSGGFSVKRTGRDLRITDNEIVNSSEHAIYLTTTDTTVKGNTIRTTDETICTSDPLKIRARGFNVAENTISGYTRGITINEPSMAGTVSSNTIYSQGDAQGGIIDINSNTLTTFIDARPWMVGNYVPMGHISITGNTIVMPEASQTYGYAFRIYTAASDANFPEGQIQNIRITGNTISNPRSGIYIYNTLFKGIVFVNNSIFGKPFTSSGFDDETSLDTYAAIEVPDAGTNNLAYFVFDENYVYGSEYLFATTGEGGTNVYLPKSMQNNRLEYIQNFKTSDFRTTSTLAIFRNNTGTFFLDRTGWIGVNSFNNNMHDGSTENSRRKYTFEYTGGNVVFITDDSATTLQLNN